MKKNAVWVLLVTVLLVGGAIGVVWKLTSTEPEQPKKKEESAAKPVEEEYLAPAPAPSRPSDSGSSSSTTAEPEKAEPKPVEVKVRGHIYGRVVRNETDAEKAGVNGVTVLLVDPEDPWNVISSSVTSRDVPPGASELLVDKNKPAAEQAASAPKPNGWYSFVAPPTFTEERVRSLSVALVSNGYAIAIEGGVSATALTAARLTTEYPSDAEAKATP